MLWPINGWSWSDAISNLSSRSIAFAAGISLSHFFFGLFNIAIWYLVHSGEVVVSVWISLSVCFWWRSLSLILVKKTLSLFTKASFGEKISWCRSTHSLTWGKQKWKIYSEIVMDYWLCIPAKSLESLLISHSECKRQKCNLLLILKCVFDPRQRGGGGGICWRQM